jgi:hypothetical protein
LINVGYLWAVVARVTDRIAVLIGLSGVCNFGAVVQAIGNGIIVRVQVVVLTGAGVHTVRYAVTVGVCLVRTAATDSWSILERILGAFIDRILAVAFTIRFRFSVGDSIAVHDSRRVAG